MHDEFIQFYGVRGSYPVSSPRVAHFGGNTASILVSRDTSLSIFDAGTGIINIGRDIVRGDSKRKHIDIFLTHFHMDHIQGLPFFKPVFDPDYHINIFCPDFPNIVVEDLIHSLFNDPISPISDRGIKANMNITRLPLNRAEPIELESGIRIDYMKENSHPLSGVLIYKLSIDDRCMVYATDVESPDGFDDETVEFIRGSQVLIHDSQYFESDYRHTVHPRAGFGHSTCSMATGNALSCEVEKLFLFHYHPDYSDIKLKTMLTKARKRFPQTFLARETLKFRLRS
jgi:ribonuclease BN (tRNA processing enzyme)